MFYRIIFIFTFFLSANVVANDLFDIKSFEADFEQTVFNASNKKIAYSGKVFIKEPSRILWRYSDPIIKNVYVIANTAIVDEPELEQAIYTRLENEINVLQLLKKSVKKSQNLYETMINNVKYVLTLENNQIKQIDYKDELENKVSIKFTNIKQNQPIVDDTFRFIPPEYYDIIKK